MQTSRKKGFTLVELLLVIGILTVLIGILLPVLGNVRESANRVKCAANLRDIGHMFNIYLQQSRGRLLRINPLPFITPPVNPYDTLLEALEPIHRGTTLQFRCPSDRLVERTIEPPEAQTYWELYQSSYEYNQSLNAFRGGDEFVSAVKATAERLRTTNDNVFLFRDYAHFHGKRGRPEARNYLFADFHVGPLRLN